MDNTKNHFLFIVIYLAISIFPLSYSQDRMNVAQNKIHQTNELKTSITTYLKDIALQLDSLQKKNISEEYSIVEKYFWETEKLQIHLDYSLTVLEVVISADDNCYNQELVHILTKALSSIKSRLAKETEFINTQLVLCKSQRVKDSGEKLKTYLKNLNDLIEKGWKELQPYKN